MALDLDKINSIRLEKYTSFDDDSNKSNQVSLELQSPKPTNPTNPKRLNWIPYNQYKKLCNKSNNEKSIGIEINNSPRYSPKYSPRYSPRYSPKEDNLPKDTLKEDNSPKDTLKEDNLPKDTLKEDNSLRYSPKNLPSDLPDDLVYASFKKKNRNKIIKKSKYTDGNNSFYVVKTNLNETNTLQQINKSPNEKLPDEKLPNEKLPDEKLPNEKLPNEKLPNEKLPNEKLPNEKLPNEKLPNEKLPDEKLPNEKLPDEKLPDEKLPDEIDLKRRFYNEFDDLPKNLVEAISKKQNLTLKQILVIMNLHAIPLMANNAIHNNLQKNFKRKYIKINGISPALYIGHYNWYDLSSIEHTINNMVFIH
jgi:hypothetical protein